MHQLNGPPITYIGVIHDVPADFQVVLPVLEGLCSQVSSPERLAVFREYAGVALHQLRGQRPDLATVAALRRVREGDAALQRELMHLFTADQSGNWLTMELIAATVGQDSFWKALDRWLGAEKVRVFGEELPFDAWLDHLWAKICEEEAHRVLKASCLSTPESEQEYLRNIDEYMDAQASSVQRRNTSIAAQIKTVSQGSDQVAVPIGCAHAGLVLDLRAAKLHVIESEASASFTWSPTGEVVARLSIGESVSHATRTLRSFQDIVWNHLVGLARFLRGPIASLGVFRFAGQVAARWTAGEVLEFLRVSKTTDVKAVLLEWLENHGTAEERALWRLDPKEAARREASIALDHFSEAIERMAQGREYLKLVIGEGGVQITGALETEKGEIQSEVAHEMQLLLAPLRRAGFKFSGDVAIPGSYQAYRVRNLLLSVIVQTDEGHATNY